MSFEQPKPIITPEEKQAKQEQKEKSFFRNQRNKIGLVLLSLGITIAGWGCERRPEKIFNEIKKQTDQYTELVSKTEQENGYVVTIWEDPNTKKRRQISGYYRDGDYSYGFLDIPSEEEQKTKEEQRLAEEQKLADEQLRQEQKEQEIKEKAGERLDEARELMYPYEYKEEEMQELMSEAKEIYEFAGEATPEAIKEFLQGEGKDLIGLAHQIDENTAWDLAEQMVKSPQRNYQGWENFQEIPNIEEKLENIIKYTLPEGWANYNVRNIIFESEGSYIGDFKKETNTLSIGGAGLSEIIKIQAKVARESEVINPKDEIEKTFVHEYIHAAGDPEFSDNVPLGLKIKLEKMKQGFWKKCFKSGFNIPTEDLEKRKLFNAHEAREALANIMGDYLKDPALKDRNNRASSPERRDFCENYLKTMDPDFDAKKAADLREKILAGWRVKENSSGVVMLLPPEKYP